MTSVPSLLRLSNGSKFLFIFFLLGTLMSCGSSKSVSKRTRTYKPKITQNTDKKKKKKPRIDTVKWSVTSPADMPPIGDSPFDSYPLLKKESYNISMFLPMSGARQERFEHYYAGARMALRKLESEGISLNVDVFDTKGNEREFESQLRSLDNRLADVIVGPYDVDGVKLAADYAKKNEILAISPWKANSRMTYDNPYYLQFNPNRDTHFEAIVREATKNHSTERLYIVSSPNTKDKSKVELLKAIHASQIGRESSTIEDLIIHPDSLLVGESVFIPYLSESQSTGFIIWQYDRRSENFVYNCLRKLNAEKGVANVSVYGMPMMLTSSKIGVDLYNNLDVNICTAKFVDRAIPNVKSFERQYYAEYGTLPEHDAIEAFDLITFIGRCLYEYGTAFQFHIQGQKSTDLLQAQYQFRQFTPINYLSPRGLDRSDTDEFGYFENEYLDMVHFDRGRLKRKAD